uniref:Uncharacterized protein LOC114340890 n=1 Tax=Diabrotica virgifera virgifera TaxID=50390 RepID=A0A6P7GDD7_DIAVI
MFQNIDGCSEVDESDINLWLEADNNGGYAPLTDEAVIALCLPDASESDAENADGDIEQPVMSHGDAMTQLDALMVYFERQAETSPAELLMLKRLRDRTARTNYTGLTNRQAPAVSSVSVKPPELIPLRPKRPNGMNLDWRTWWMLNRICTDLAPVKQNLIKWGIKTDNDALCECGEIENVEHLRVC